MGEKKGGEEQGEEILTPSPLPCSLNLVRQKYPKVPLMALTATATERVKLDILTNLGMRNAVVFTQSFNRPNLFYEVRKKDTKIEDEIVALSTDEFPGQCGIVYCLSRNDCERVAQRLQVKGGGGRRLVGIVASITSSLPPPPTNRSEAWRRWSTMRAWTPRTATWRRTAGPPATCN